MLSHFIHLLPVYTLGLRENPDPDETSKLISTGAEVVHSDRGGLTTFHGPGQLVAYPIFHLGSFRKLPLRSYIAKLELVAVQTCRLLGVLAQLSGKDVSHTGAWANDAKICAIGTCSYNLINNQCNRSFNCLS